MIRAVYKTEYRWYSSCMSNMTVRDIVLARLFGRVDGMMVSMPSGLKFVADAMAEEPDMAGPVLRSGRWVVLGSDQARLCVTQFVEILVRAFPSQTADALTTSATLGEMNAITRPEFEMLCRWLPDGSWKWTVPVEAE